jgi:hypothetical protein
VTCHKTGQRIPIEFAFICMGNVYAADQVPTPETCARCEYVVADYEIYKDYEGKNMFLCTKCSKSMHVCYTCHAPLAKSFYGSGFCIACIELTDMRRPTRRYYYGKKWCGDKTGAILQSPRIFSFEMEATLKGNKNVIALGNTLPLEAGLSGDSSIQTSGYAIEVQSPKLQGARGEEFTSRVTAALKGQNAVVNESCGMHIHLDGVGIVPESRAKYPKALIDMWKAYLVFEDVMFSFLPFNRRLNVFCRPLRDYFKLSELDMIETVFDAEKLWYKQQESSEIRSQKQHHHHASRYFGVNLHSLLANGHLELRHHSGTINTKKVLQWANLHALIMDAAVAGKFTTVLLNEAQATTSIKDKTTMLFEAIGLSKTSRTYFYQRQVKFSDKGQVEDGVVPITRQRHIARFEPRFFEVDELADNVDYN